MRDLLYAARGLFATPLVSLVAVLSLGLGIGANTAIFSLLNGLVLRPLPVHEPERLALLLSSETDVATSWTYPIWEQLRDRRDIAAGAAAWSIDRFNLADAGQSEPVEGLWVSGEFFGVLGVPAAAGRTFTAADDRVGGDATGAPAVISYRFWQRRFGGSPSAIGQRLTVNRVPYTIVGVTPAQFLGPAIGRAFDVALPIGTEPLMRGAESALTQRSYWWLSVIFRMRDDQTMTSLAAALRAVQPQIRAATTPTHYRPQDRANYLAQPFVVKPGGTGESGLRERYQRPLATLMVIVVLVLLVACANIANLLLARASARRHELSVRVALGASRSRLARERLAESLLLSAAGAALGLVLAAVFSRLLLAQLSTQVRTAVVDLGIDWRVGLFTLLATVATTLLFGTAPALLATRARPAEAIKEQSRTFAGERRWSLGNALVVFQVALCVVLVFGAGLFVRSFVQLSRVHLGFEAGQLLVASVNTQHAAVAASDRAALFTRLATAVRQTPGVAAATFSDVTPLGSSMWNTAVELPHLPDLPERDRGVMANAVGPQFFTTYGTRLLAGREIDERDTLSAPPVVVVNEAFVAKFFRDRPAVGGYIVTVQGATAKRPVQIIGVVETAKYRSLREAGLPTVYFAMRQLSGTRPLRPEINVTARAANASPALLVRSLRSALAGVDANLSFSFRLMDDQIGGARTQERLIAMLSGFFGVLALVLAGLGLYGVTAYAVVRRRAEIGIRLALGATGVRIMSMVIGRVAVLVGAGAVAGAAASWWGTRFTASLLFGLQPRDGATMIAALAVLGGVGLLAGAIPARKAAAIDPMAVLRR
jgi:predicted permease